MTASKQKSARPISLWQRMTGVWRRTERARAIAQIPMIALSPTAGPVADQVRLAPSADLIEIRRETDLEQQRQWAHHELRRIEDRTAHVIQDNAHDASPSAIRATRNRDSREHDR